MIDENLQQFVEKAVERARQGPRPKLHLAISNVGWVSGLVAVPPSEADGRVHLYLTGTTIAGTGWPPAHMVIPLAHVVAWAVEGDAWSLW